MRTRAATAVALPLLALTLATPGSASTEQLLVTRLAGPSRIETAIDISRATFATAEAAVLARADDFADALAAAPLAAALGGPLLLTPTTELPAGVSAELDRLGATEVVIVGGETAVSGDVESNLRQGRAVRRIHGPHRYATAAAIADELVPTGRAVIATGSNFPDALAVAPVAALRGDPILLVADTVPEETASSLAARGVTDVTIVGGPGAVSAAVEADLATRGITVRRIAGTTRFETAAAAFDAALAAGGRTSRIWLADGYRFPDALAAGPAAAAGGEALLLVDGRDLRRVDATIERLRRHTHAIEQVILVGGTGVISSDATWQARVVTRGEPLPRGGHLLFPRHRMVAFYGHHSVAAMGVLGEQPPDAAYDRLWAQASPYARGDRSVLPTFELIVSVATKSAGTDGDYSSPSTPAQIQPWLDAARRHDTYLLLDLQTGRTDFLTEAKRYESFLVQPDVGLALDPEWRMEPDERPGQTIGSVDAAEVNQVVDYLATLVRDHALPEKLLVVHQFRTDMVTNRDRIRNPAELAVLFHMDGHGSQAQKLDTYRWISITDGRYANGFKLFYDEDRDLFEPHEVLRLTPVPDFVSYQ